MRSGMNAGSARFAYEYAQRPNVFPLNNVIEQGTNCKLRNRANSFFFRMSNKAGGARRDRTDDLLNANQALSQLSYGPNHLKLKVHATPRYGGPGTTRTYDLTLIRGAL